MHVKKWKTDRTRCFEIGMDEIMKFCKNSEMLVYERSIELARNKNIAWREKIIDLYLYIVALKELSKKIWSEQKLIDNGGEGEIIGRRRLALKKVKVAEIEIKIKNQIDSEIDKEYLKACVAVCISLRGQIKNEGEHLTFAHVLDSLTSSIELKGLRSELSKEEVSLNRKRLL